MNSYTLTKRVLVAVLRLLEKRTSLEYASCVLEKLMNQYATNPCYSKISFPPHARTPVRAVVVSPDLHRVEPVDVSRFLQGLLRAVLDLMAAHRSAFILEFEACLGSKGVMALRQRGVRLKTEM